jgi:hypothetical protein
MVVPEVVVDLQVDQVVADTVLPIVVIAEELEEVPVLVEVEELVVEKVVGMVVNGDTLEVVTVDIEVVDILQLISTQFLIIIEE